MIKRRFYKMEHGDRDDPSNQSSSSSDSEIEVEPEATDHSEYDDDDDDVIEDHKEDAEPCSTSSGLFVFFLARLLRVLSICFIILSFFSFDFSVESLSVFFQDIKARIAQQMKFMLTCQVGFD